LESRVNGTQDAVHKRIAAKLNSQENQKRQYNTEPERTYEVNNQNGENRNIAGLLLQ
jgi:hypothetical protein